MYTANAIESLNARFRRSVRRRGHFPNEHAALKVLYLVATQHRANRANLSGKINRLEAHPQRAHHPLRRPPRHEQPMTVTSAYTKNPSVIVNTAASSA